MFELIDLDSWERKEYYNHFLNVCPCSFNVTAEVDIAPLFRAVKAGGYKLYAALIYVFSRVINEDSHFRMGTDEQGRPGYYDACSPSYTIPNALPDGFSGIWTAHDDDFAVFHERYLADVRQYGQSKRYAPKPKQPKGTFYVSCVPRLHFTALSVDVPDASGFAPLITAGKFKTADERVLLPVSVRFHHAVCDGRQAEKFFERVQFFAADPSFVPKRPS